MVYPATWLVFGTVAFVLLLFGLGYWWARAEGQLENVEDAKYAMLVSEDDEEGQHT